MTLGTDYSANDPMSWRSKIRCSSTDGGSLLNNPDWGLGQVQSSIDSKITVNFEHVGKVVIDARVVDLLQEPFE